MSAEANGGSESNGAEGPPPEDITVLVTGGAGYTGSHTILVLLQRGYNVVVVDNCVNCAPPPQPSRTTPPTGSCTEDDTLSPGGGALPPSLERVRELCGRAPVFYKVSLSEAHALNKILTTHKIDCVIHFAALKAVGESVQQPLAYYKNNLTATITLVEAMQSAGVFRLVFSSSATVYGVPKYLPIDEQHPVGQDITNPYGQTKFMSEQILSDLVNSDQRWKVILLRYFNPVGAHPSGLIGEDPIGVPNNLMPFIAQVAVGRRDKLSVFGGDFDTPDGTGVRDYIHVMDLAEGHVATIEHLLKAEYQGCRAYNLGTGVGISVMQMLRAFESACGRPLKHEVVQRRAGDCSEMVACCGRAHTELRWKATRTLQDMCNDTWRWQNNNPNGYTQ